MKALILEQAQDLYKTFRNFRGLSRRDKIIHIGVLLLSLALAATAVIWLPRLFDHYPWMAYIAGAFLFIQWMRREGYPALKRRLTEEYREIATGGLPQVARLCKRLYKDPGPFWVVLRFVIFLLLLYPFAVVFHAMLPIIVNPIFLFTLFGVCSLAFIHWVWRRAYPALQQQLGPTGMRYMSRALKVGTVALAAVLAHQYLNGLTEVAPDNFPKAFAVLSFFALVPASIFIVGLVAALFGFGLMVVMVIDGIGCHLRNHWQQFRAMWTGSQPQTWFLPHWRIPVNIIGAFGVFGFCSLLVVGEVPPTSQVSRIVAAYTLVWTEFSHDYTCPASSKERLVARLKEFKEAKPPRVLFAEQASWGDVHFRIDTCEKPAQ